jgi:hypothetical protein
MISGPDLGGGYLHQLTREVRESEARFVFHAQAGGQDAGGPAKGPLDGLGWFHPDTACQFGGPNCWHREFTISAGEEARVRATYNRTRFVFEAQLGQLYSGVAVPIRDALAEVVTRLRPLLEAAGVWWHVRGSTSCLLQGVATLPREIELVTTGPGVSLIAEGLVEYLIEPVARTRWPGRAEVLGARAFVGTLARGARVSWSGGAERVLAGGTSREERAPEAEAGVCEVVWEGQPLRVSRLEVEFVHAILEGRDDGAKAIAPILRSQGPDLEMVRRLLERGGAGTAASERAEKLLRDSGPDGAGSERRVET